MYAAVTALGNGGGALSLWDTRRCIVSVLSIRKASTYPVKKRWCGGKWHPTRAECCLWVPCGWQQGLTYRVHRFRKREGDQISRPLVLPGGYVCVRRAMFVADHELVCFSFGIYYYAFFLVL